MPRPDGEAEFELGDQKAGGARACCSHRMGQMALCRSFSCQVLDMCANDYAFAARTSSGSVVAWGTLLRRPVRRQSRSRYHDSTIYQLPPPCSHFRLQSYKVTDRQLPRIPAKERLRRPQTHVTNQTSNKHDLMLCMLNFAVGIRFVRDVSSWLEQRNSSRSQQIHVLLSLKPSNLALRLQCYIPRGPFLNRVWQSLLPSR